MGKRENLVEAYLDQQVTEKLGGITRKYTSPGKQGVADRLVLLPGARTLFVECKTLNGRERPGQERERKRMRKLGFEAIVVGSTLDVDMMIATIKMELRLC